MTYKENQRAYRNLLSVGDEVHNPKSGVVYEVKKLTKRKVYLVCPMTSLFIFRAYITYNVANMHYELNIYLIGRMRRRSKIK